MGSLSIGQVMNHGTEVFYGIKPLTLYIKKKKHLLDKVWQGQDEEDPLSDSWKDGQQPQLSLLAGHFVVLL